MRTPIGAFIIIAISALMDTYIFQAQRRHTSHNGFAAANIAL